MVKRKIGDGFIFHTIRLGEGFIFHAIIPAVYPFL